MWEAQYYKHDTPRSLITSGGLGTMGFALPAAIGAKVACPEKDVWVIAGDGGFQMTAAELSTIVQEKLAINIAVINNGFLGMVRQWQEAFYDKNYAASPILSPDFVKLAAAHGIDGATVNQRQNVTPTVTKARTSNKPFLINFQVEKEDGVYPMIAPGSALHEMVRRPTKRPTIRNRGGRIMPGLSHRLPECKAAMSQPAKSGLKARATVAWGKAPGARPATNRGLKVRAKSSIPDKPLIEGNVVLRKHRPHLRLKISLFMMRTLCINVPNQREPIAQANGEDRVAPLPSKPGKLWPILLNPLRRRDLQPLNHSRDRFRSGKKHRDVHVIGNTANSNADIFRTVQNGGQISMHLTLNSILQKRTPIFGTKHQMNENIREGLGHAGKYNASLQHANLASTTTWGCAPGYNNAGLQPAPQTTSDLKARARRVALTVLVLLCAIPSHAQPSHQLRIRIINAKTNQPIPDERLNVALRTDQIGSVAMATDKTGVILVDPGHATTIRILANMYADCRPRAELYTDYSIDTIRRTGITTGNLCGGTPHTAKPGELLLYEIPKTYIPAFGEPPASNLPHSDENPHVPPKPQ